MVQFIFEGVQKFVLFHLADNLSVSDQKSFADSSGNTDIRFPGLSGSVDGTAHHGHFDVQVVSLHHGFHPVGEADKVNFGPAAGRT